MPDVTTAARRLSGFFIVAAWVELVLGILAALGAGYNATHVSSAGQTYTISDAFPHFLLTFVGVAGLVCVGAAMLAFFGYVLALLSDLVASSR